MRERWRQRHRAVPAAAESARFWSKTTLTSPPATLQRPNRGGKRWEAGAGISAGLCYRGDNRTPSSPTSSTVRGMQIRYSLINIVPLRRRRQHGVWRRLQICKSPDSAWSALHPNTLPQLCASPGPGVHTVLPPLRCQFGQLLQIDGGFPSSLM